MHYSLQSSRVSLLVELVGDFTFNDSDLFGKIRRAMQPRGPRLPVEVRFDMKRLTAIDSSALALLIEANEEAVRCHQKLVLENPQGSVKQRLCQAAGVYTSLSILSESL